MMEVAFWNIALAKSFRWNETGEDFTYAQNRVEQVGHALRWGMGSILDVTLREIKNPITIVSLTAIALFAVTIAYYPTTALMLVTKICPWVNHLEPWMVKFALYLSVQTTLLGVGFRALGRFGNDELLKIYRTGDLKAVFIGDRS